MKKPKDSRRLYVLFDERAAGGDTDRATCLWAIGPVATLEQAKSLAVEQWGETGFCLYSYEWGDELGQGGERFEYHHVPQEAQRP